MGVRDRGLKLLYGVLVSAAVLVASCGDSESEDEGVSDDTTTSSVTVDADRTTSTDSVDTEERDDIAPVDATWSLVAAGDSDFGIEGIAAGDADLLDVVSGGPGFVAVGAVENLPAVWTSPDGVSWTRATDVPDTVFGGSGFGGLVVVTTGGPGLVAMSGQPPYSAGEIAVWTSADGLSWEHVGGHPSLFGGTEPVDMTAGGPGLVAIGKAVVWTSPDGLSWTRVATLDAFRGAEMRAVTAGGPGLVAVGSTADNNRAVVWTSPDGLSWTRLPEEALVGEFSYPLGAVVLTSTYLAALGEDASLWISTDGKNWTNIMQEGKWGRSVTALTADDSKVVVVGSVDFLPAVWNVDIAG